MKIQKIHIYIVLFFIGVGMFFFQQTREFAPLVTGFMIGAIMSSKMENIK